MVEIELIPDFSKLKELGRPVTDLDRKLATGFGREFVRMAGLDRLKTSDGSNIIAMVKAESKQVYVTPLPGRHITNIDEFAKLLHDEVGSILGNPLPETFAFTKMTGQRVVQYIINTRLPNKDEGIAIPQPGKVPQEALDALDNLLAEVAVPEQKLPEDHVQILPPTIEEIAQYGFVGERKGRYISDAYNTNTASRCVDVLRKILSDLTVFSKEKVHAAYTVREDGTLKIDIFPPKGTRITEATLTHEAELTEEQKQGMIRFTYCGNDVVLHRKHLYGKFDIRGGMTTTVPQNTLTQPTPDLELKVLRMILFTPIIIISDDDTEANVIYQPTQDPGRIYVCPKEGANLETRGLKEAEAQKILHVRSRAGGRTTDIEVYKKLRGEKEGSYGIIVFAGISEGVRALALQGGSPRRDIFNRFEKDRDCVYKK